MTENEKERYNKYRWFLEQVEPYEGFEVDDYYGIQSMKVKKNGTFDLRLQYDYESNAKNGSPFKVETIAEVIEWLFLMDSFCVDKSINRKAKKYNPKEAKDYTIKKAKTKDELASEAKDDSWD